MSSDKKMPATIKQKRKLNMDVFASHLGRGGNLDRRAGMRLHELSYDSMP